MTQNPDDLLHCREESAWVIEHIASEACNPDYFCGYITSEKAWQKDHTKALRFARRRDAEIIRDTLLSGGCHRLAEHVWLDNSTFPTRQPTANNEKLREAAQSLIDTLMRYTHYQMVWKDIDKLKAALADSPVQKPAENEQVSKLRGALKRILARDYGIFGMTSRERLDFVEAIVKDALAETPVQKPAENEQVSKLREALRWLHNNFDYEPCVAHREREITELLNLVEALAETDTQTNVEFPLHDLETCKESMGGSNPNAATIESPAIPEQDVVQKVAKAIHSQLPGGGRWEEAWENEEKFETTTGMFREMAKAAIAAMPQRKVNVEDCAIAASQWVNGNDYGEPRWSRLKSTEREEYRSQVRAILDVVKAQTGVDYE